MSTLLPAASTMSPFSAVIRPVFSTSVAISSRGPSVVRRVPSLRSLPAAPSASNLSFPLLKSWLLMFSVDATRPAVSTLAPAPNRMPFGLIRKTRPLAIRLPRICDGSWPTTRLSTVAVAPGWMKRVVSPGWMENCRQWMMALSPAVMFSVLPCCCTPTCPWITWWPVGLAMTRPGSAAAMAATRRRRARPPAPFPRAAVSSGAGT